MYLVGNDRTELFDRDEPRFAEAAREMLQTGDFVVPRFGGEVRYDKPILAYYFIAAGMAVFGVNEFGARFASAVFSALSIIVFFRLARNILRDDRKALLAAAILAGAPLMVAEARLCTVDALLLLLLVLSFTGLWRIYEGPCENRWKVLFWAALALAVLAKGPVALAAVFGAVFFLVAISRDRSFLGRMAWPWGVPLFVLILMPWVMAVQERTGGEFLRVALGRHVVGRTAQPMESHEGFPGYYLVTIFATFFPWAFFAPGALRDAFRGLRDKVRETFLVSWVCGLLVVLELVETKMVHYALPVFPALSILVADYLVACHENRDRRLVWGVRAAGVMGLALAVAFPLAALKLGTDAAIGPLATAGIVLVAAMIWWNAVVSRRGAMRIGAGIAAVYAWLLVMTSWAVPALMNESPSKDAAALVATARASLGGDAKVGVYGYREPSIVFYLAEAPFFERPVDVEMLYAPGAPDILVVSTRERGLLELLQESDFEHVGRTEGFNFAKGQEERLSIWARPASAQPPSAQP
jgi:4-amino-4-deoxy-L-arabinose transferase-like glycosyltransferase